MKETQDIVQNIFNRITQLIDDANPESEYRKAFDGFLNGLRANINPTIAKGEAIEMLAQHIVTKPVFDALFEGYSFVQHNPISLAMQSMLDLLEGQVEKDTETLQKFYESVKMRAAGIDNAAGKQKIILELYDKFFKTACTKMSERLGIGYTPVEVGDFMRQAVKDEIRTRTRRSTTSAVTPENPCARDRALRRVAARTTSTSRNGPIPAACERMSATCVFPRSSDASLVLAKDPTPVFTP